MACAGFDPGPVHKSKGAGDCKGLPKRDGPWRGEEEEIGSQEDGRESVEGEVGDEGELGPFGDDEVPVDEAEGPVEDADEDFERGGTNGEGVFEAEE